MQGKLLRMKYKIMAERQSRKCAIFKSVWRFLEEVTWGNMSDSKF